MELLPDDPCLLRTRRHLFRDCAVGLGGLALTSLLAEESQAAGNGARGVHFPAKAKRVIYMHMAGGPSQIDLFDPKPLLRNYDGQPAPKSFTDGKRFAFIKSDAKLLASPREFKSVGKNGQVIGTLLPHLMSVADDICLIKSMQTDVFNHGPAKLFLSTGSAQAGRPAMGAWLTYGL